MTGAATISNSTTNLIFIAIFTLRIESEAAVGRISCNGANHASTRPVISLLAIRFLECGWGSALPDNKRVNRLRQGMLLSIVDAAITLEVLDNTAVDTAGQEITCRYTRGAGQILRCAWIVLIGMRNCARLSCDQQKDDGSQPSISKYRVHASVYKAAD